MKKRRVFAQVKIDNELVFDEERIEQGFYKYLLLQAFRFLDKRKKYGVLRIKQEDGEWDYYPYKAGNRTLRRNNKLGKRVWEEGWVFDD